jgi:hypothetical protein
MIEKLKWRLVHVPNVLLVAVGTNEEGTSHCEEVFCLGVHFMRRAHCLVCFKAIHVSVFS